DLPEGLFQRGRSWIYRKVIPPEVRQQMGRREWHVSLGPITEVEARALAVVESVLAERAVHQAREALLLDEAGAHPHDRNAALDALPGLLERESDAVRRTILAALLRRTIAPGGGAP